MSERDFWSVLRDLEIIQKQNKMIMNENFNNFSLKNEYRSLIWEHFDVSESMGKIELKKICDIYKKKCNFYEEKYGLKHKIPKDIDKLKNNSTCPIDTEYYAISEYMYEYHKMDVYIPLYYLLGLNAWIAAYEEVKNDSETVKIFENCVQHLKELCGYYLSKYHGCNEIKYCGFKEFKDYDFNINYTEGNVDREKESKRISEELDEKILKKRMCESCGEFTEEIYNAFKKLKK